MNRKNHKFDELFESLESEFGNLFEKQLGQKKYLKSYMMKLGNIMSVILLTDYLIGHLQSSQNFGQFQETINQWILDIERLKKQFFQVNALMVMGAKGRERIKMGYFITQVVKLVGKILQKNQELKDCSEEKLFQRLHIILHGKQISVKCYELSRIKKGNITIVHSNEKLKKTTHKKSASLIKKNTDFQNTFFPSNKQQQYEQKQKQKFQKKQNYPKVCEYKVKNLLARVQSTIQIDINKIAASSSSFEKLCPNPTQSLKKTEGDEEQTQEKERVLSKPETYSTKGKIKEQKGGCRISKHLQQIIDGQKKYSKSITYENCFTDQKRSPPTKKLLRILLPIPQAFKNC